MCQVDGGRLFVSTLMGVCVVGGVGAGG